MIKQSLLVVIICCASTASWAGQLGTCTMKLCLTSNTQFTALVDKLESGRITKSNNYYHRKLWLTNWADYDNDCQNTRTEILIRDSQVPVTFKTPKSCDVSHGQWVDPYTGKTILAASNIDIDHIVPLKHAHNNGGSNWPSLLKELFANDPDNLLTTENIINRKKGSNSLVLWKPPNKAYWCDFSTKWETVKNKYNLKLNNEEEKHVSDMKQYCKTDQEVKTRKLVEIYLESQKQLLSDSTFTAENAIKISDQPEINSVLPHNENFQDEKDWQVLKDLFVRDLRSRGDHWKCSMNKQINCTQDTCSTNNNPPTWIELDFNNMTYKRCDKKSCDSYQLDYSKSGIYSTAAPVQSRQTFMKILNDGTSFHEVASFGEAVLIGFGKCITY